jgi:hemolysin III
VDFTLSTRAVACFVSPFMSSNPTPAHLEERFSVALFLATLGLTLGGLCGLLAWLFPAFWRAQLDAPWYAFVAVFVFAHTIAGGFEYFFHRYVLHAPLFGVLSYFYKQHTLHHALTRIVQRPSSVTGENLPTLVEVENRYPITQEHQHEASFFPWYTLAVFSLIMTPLFLLGHLVFPSAPWLLAGWSGITFSLALYELVHAVEHWPVERWHRLIARPRTGPMWRKAYAFHLRHHADIRCNEGISGVFTIPIYDFIFGTYVDPTTLYGHGDKACPTQFHSPQPRVGFIRWLDRHAESAVKRRRERRAAA